MAQLEKGTGTHKPDSTLQKLKRGTEKAIAVAAISGSFIGLYGCGSKTSGGPSQVPAWDESAYEADTRISALAKGNDSITFAWAKGGGAPDDRLLMKFQRIEEKKLRPGMPACTFEGILYAAVADRDGNPEGVMLERKLEADEMERELKSYIGNGKSEEETILDLCGFTDKSGRKGLRIGLSGDERFQNSFIEMRLMDK